MTSCPRLGECVNPAYEFNIALKLNPNKDTLQIGDTLWLSASFTDRIKGTNGRTFDYQGANIAFSVAFFKFVNADSQSNRLVGSAFKFNYVVEKGEMLSQGNRADAD
jgi:hypothetical protein